MTSTAVVSTESLAEFFRTNLKEASARQHLALAEPTQAYLVRLLSGFARTEALFRPDADGRPRPPLLARLLADALSKPSAVEREGELRHLGDVALFLAGFLAHGFARKLVDVDYCAAMGGHAYGTLADAAGSARLKAIRPVFGELAAKFVAVADALGDIADQARPPNPDDLMRYYEIWAKTGSARARAKLIDCGITPVAGGCPRARH